MTNRKTFFARMSNHDGMALFNMICALKPLLPGVSIEMHGVDGCDRMDVCVDYTLPAKWAENPDAFEEALNKLRGMIGD